jgi:predicted PurR-regulated permease PerM
VKTFAQRVFIAAVIVGALWVAASVMQWFLLIFAGVLLAILFRTAAGRLSRWTGLSFRWCIAIVLIATACLVVGGVWEFGSKIIGEADALMSKLSDALESLREHGQKYQNLWRMVAQTSVDLKQPTETLLYGGIKTGAALALVLFVAAYVSIDPRTYIDGFLNFCSQRRQRQLRVMLDDIHNALKWWLLGQLIAMAVVGVITTVGLLIIQAPMALPLGLLAALLTFVPYVGPIVSAVPALMIAFTVSTRMALYVAIVFLIAHAAEGYVVSPMVQKRFVYLPPALILANQFLMQLLFGIVGVAIATPFLVLVMVLVDQLYFGELWSDKQEAA